MVALKKQRKFVGGFAPFGYRKALDDKLKLLIDEEAAAVVRRIFHLVLEEMSMYQICQVLNIESVPTPAVYMNEKFGRRDAHMEKNENQYWTVGKIKRILDNEVYTGTLVAGKARAASVGSKKRVHIDEEDWIRVADTQEAIISREIFDKAQELRAKGFFFGTKKHESHVLCGKVICGSCGRNMAHSYQGIPKFLCNNKYFSPDTKDVKDTKDLKDTKECKCVDSIHDKDLEGIVIGAIEDAAARATDTARIREKSSHQLFVKRKEIGNEISKLTANIARSDEVLMKKYEEYLEGKLSREEYQDQRRKIDNENTGIQDQEQQLQERLDSDTCLQAKRITGLDLLADCVKVEELTQELVDSLVEKVVVKNGKAVEVRLKVRV